VSVGLNLELPEGLVDELAQLVAERIGTQGGPERWVGVAKAADHLDCKPQRIYDLVHRQDETRIPHRKEGGRLLFKLSELDRWVERGRLG
jgi:Helix-turn-helix domain